MKWRIGSGDYFETVSGERANAPDLLCYREEGK